MKDGDKVRIVECEEDAALVGLTGTIVPPKDEDEMLNPDCYMVEIPGVGANGTPARIGFHRDELAGEDDLADRSGARNAGTSEYPRNRSGND